MTGYTCNGIDKKLCVILGNTKVLEVVVRHLDKIDTYIYNNLFLKVM